MAKYYVRIDTNGTFRYKDPEMTICHCERGPAIELSNGDKFWYVNGKAHRLDGPAIEHHNGVYGWFVDGKAHREDGPAFEFADGSVQYWLNGHWLTKEQWEAALRPAEELTVRQSD